MSSTRCGGATCLPLPDGRAPRRRHDLRLREAAGGSATHRAERLPSVSDGDRVSTGESPAGQRLLRPRPSLCCGRRTARPRLCHRRREEPACGVPPPCSIAALSARALDREQGNDIQKGRIHMSRRKLFGAALVMIVIASAICRRRLGWERCTVDDGCAAPNR